MEDKKIYSKETLLVYLINELSNGNFEVITHLDGEGCWLGHIEIKVSDNEKNEDIEYYKKIAKNLLTNE